ncbi:MAG: hypothetical protein ACJASL_000752 [Paraglaciecola sp.]|jgi:hypothetical protein
MAFSAALAMTNVSNQIGLFESDQAITTFGYKYCRSGQTSRKIWLTYNDIQRVCLICFCFRLTKIESLGVFNTQLLNNL